ncbi:hypothetical protein MRX96_039911 [Rhipicephalus microplus]
MRFHGVVSVDAAVLLYWILVTHCRGVVNHAGCSPHEPTTRSESQFGKPRPQTIFNRVLEQLYSDQVQNTGVAPSLFSCSSGPWYGAWSDWGRLSRALPCLRATCIVPGALGPPHSRAFADVVTGAERNLRSRVGTGSHCPQGSRAAGRLLGSPAPAATSTGASVTYKRTLNKERV